METIDQHASETNAKFDGIVSQLWFNGAFSKVVEAGHVAGSRTNRKVPDSFVKYINQNSRASPDP
ncbi:hypothetical protein TRIUR3_16660 [Triticum urartu]|uniref:Uncharacterized protein n=1 Tax=Triticum urartu TaxID=4572 RepID=M7ZTF0_TRIUA|nr:hypothetical protein TRIUR3_16660 [Triticum urartu]